MKRLHISTRYQVAWRTVHGPDRGLRKPTSSLRAEKPIRSFLMNQPAEDLLHRHFPFSVEPYSGQEPGEDLWDFLSRRSVKNRDREARESTSDRKRRLEREAISREDQVPPAKGARVYVWEPSRALHPPISRSERLRRDLGILLACPTRV